MLLSCVMSNLVKCAQLCSDSYENAFFVELYVLYLMQAIVLSLSVGEFRVQVYPQKVTKFDIF